MFSGLLVDVRAASHDALHVPPPHCSRCEKPVDENQSFDWIPLTPVRKLDGADALFDRPSFWLKSGTKAPRASATRADCALESSRTTARSGL